MMLKSSNHGSAWMEFPLRRRFLAALLSLPALPAAAQDRIRGGAPHPAAQGPALQLLQDPGHGQRAVPIAGNAFPENQRELLFNVLLGRGAARQRFQVQVIGVRTTYSNGFNVTRAEGDTDADGTLPVTLTIRRDWPVGEYTVIVSQDGREVANLPFVIRAVSPRNTPLSVPSIEILRQVQGGRSEPTPRPRARDRELVFAATIEGARTDGADVTWVLRAVDTTAGAGVILDRELPRQYIENSEITFEVEVERDWWIGRYRVEVVVDGRVVGARDFDIAE